jgi:hypothetical protein
MLGFLRGDRYFNSDEELGRTAAVVGRTARQGRRVSETRARR